MDVTLSQPEIDYYRIEQAIKYLVKNWKKQPSLDDVAAHVYMSPYHFQRMFTAWAGVSPKHFLQYLTIDHAKATLSATSTLSDAASSAGLSGTGRLHDLFVKIEAMTPGEYKLGGKNLNIHYAVTHSIFGEALVAATEKGVCHLSFYEKGSASAIDALKQRYPQAMIAEGSSDMVTQCIDTLRNLSLRSLAPRQAPALHLTGTPFQLKVWEALLALPAGQLSTYSSIAQAAGYPGATRAVGTAIGANPVAYLIPCHRVIRASGIIGQYRWGSARKAAMIGWEQAGNLVA